MSPLENTDQKVELKVLAWPRWKPAACWSVMLRERARALRPAGIPPRSPPGCYLEFYFTRGI